MIYRLLLSSLTIFTLATCQNQNVANILIMYDEKDNNFKSVEFLRNGKNEDMRERQKQKEDNLDKLARAD